MNDAEKNLSTVLEIIGRKFHEVFPDIQFMNDSDVPNTLIDVEMALSFLVDKIEDLESQIEVAEMGL